MKTFRINSTLGLLLGCALTASTGLAPAGNIAQRAKPAPAGPVRFAVISDPHLYEARLGTSGSAFENYLRGGDPKLVKESEAILEAAFASIIEQQVRFLIIPGDLTKDGELVSHVLMAQHLQKLEKNGVQVFVVPGNHDINNPGAVAYLGDSTRPVANTSPETFRALYQQFGYGEAIARDPGSLSYVAEPVPGLWLLAVDTCKYRENLEAGSAIIGGRISDRTMAWIEARLGEARARGKQVIAFMHHGVNAHFVPEPLIFPDYLLDDWPMASAQLAAAGLQVVFTGHYHAQDAAYPVDEQYQPQFTLCDVETGSLAQYPCAFRIVDIEGGFLNIRSERVTEINADTGGLPFPEYAETFLRTYIAPQVSLELVALLQFSPEEADALAPIVIDALVDNYAGDEALAPETWETIIELSSSLDPRRQQLSLLLAGIWSDLWPADNELVVPFASTDNSAGRPGDPATPPPPVEFGP
jgi:hypothetical protein